MHWFSHLQLRWKLLIMVMPLVLIPLLLVAFFVSNIAISQAYQGITLASKEDMSHMSTFALDLLDGHYRQFEVYRQEKEMAVQQRLGDIVDLAYNLLETHYTQYLQHRLPLESAKRAARNSLNITRMGDSGYISVMTPEGDLLVHPDAAGQNIYDARDDKGKLFIQEICQAALNSPEGKTLYTRYHWKEALLGDGRPRPKLVAYRYFAKWGWIVLASSYLDEIFDEKPFENRAFSELKQRLIEKRVGHTGFIYVADCSGRLVIHPTAEGAMAYSWMSEPTIEALHEVCENREASRWVRSKSTGRLDDPVRMKAAHLAYFKPWDWVVVVESFEDELFGPAIEIKGHIMVSVIFLSFLVSGAAGMVTFYVAKRFTFPIFMMTEEIARVRGGRQMKEISVPDALELKKLAEAFNNMSGLIRRDKQMEEKLTRMEKMASVGVLAATVAHEINNPMGVILGYASHLERKLAEDDPNYHFVQEIKSESRRCVKIVQNLLDFARVPNLTLAPTDINILLDQILDFAIGHADLSNITVVKIYGYGIPPVSIDRDQIRQVGINLILNAAGAMPDGGQLTVSTEAKDEAVYLHFEDNGQGIAEADIKDVFEPFFTTKIKGTGLGLAISRQIVEAHLGTMEIRSTVGQGTTVTVKLPIAVRKET